MLISLNSIIKPVTITAIAGLLLTTCSSVSENFSNLGSNPSYASIRPLDDKLITHPPRHNIHHYQSVHLRPSQIPDVSIAIAASGGGYRAANLTAGIMLALEAMPLPEFHSNLLEQVDYFSTVSGGGFPVSLYMNLLKHREIKQDDNTKNLSFADAMMRKPYQFKKRLRRNFAANLFQGYRGGVELENLLSENFAQIDALPPLTLADMFIDQHDTSRTVRYPLWISNATILQSRQLFQFTPDVLKSYKVNRYIHNLMIEDIQPTTEDAVYGGEIPAAVGMVASATFPYAIGGTTLWSKACEKDCYLQLFDGGLTDNLGWFSMLDILRQDKAKKKVLILIDAFQGNREPFSVSRKPPTNLDLLQSILMSSAETLQRNMRDVIPLISRSILCDSGTEQVLVVYLSMSQEDNAPYVSLGLWITETMQNALLEIGQRLVKTNATLNHDLPKMLADTQYAHC